MLVDYAHFEATRVYIDSFVFPDEFGLFKYSEVNYSVHFQELVGSALLMRGLKVRFHGA